MIYAERDLVKAQNILKHKEEIYNRPRRQWIMTKDQKKELHE